EDEQAAVLQFLEDFASFPFDRAAALTAGDISAELAGDGRMIDAEDIMIGAIALEHGEPVVTADADHFQRISGLDVETY
ncbi:MAG: PIN domain-containing protein, partial [Candidatus Nanohaloarchaea archaeon]